MSKEELKNKIKSNVKGITLVALVVTVIVLLILAGVSIGLVFDSDGLFRKASETANKYNTAAKSEIDDIENLSNIIDIAANRRPIIEKIEVAELKTNSAKIKVKAIDGDGEKLTYKLYIGIEKDKLEEKRVLEEIEQGTEITFDVTDINIERTYYYRIDVSDKYVTESSGIGILQNKKPIIENAELIDIAKTTITLKVKANDEDSDKLTYKVYIGTEENKIEEKAKAENIKPGEERILDVTELKPGTTYFYKVEVNDGMQIVSTQATTFTTISNKLPVIEETITKDITIAEDTPLNSTSWIQVAAKVTDEDGDPVTVKVYFGTKDAENLDAEDLIRN